MKRTLIAAVALTAVLGTAACGNDEQQPVVSSNPHVAICGGSPETKPKTLEVGCSGTYVFSDLTWSSWENERAVGTGTLSSNSCDPNCAKGKMTEAENVTVTLGDPDSDGRFQTATFDGTTRGLS